jgi:hypothetical protein
MIDPLVGRVLRRFTSGVVPLPETVAEPDPYTITSVALARYLFPDYGAVLNLRFRPSLPGLPNTVEWDAVNERDQLVKGRIVLHGGVGADDSIILWPEVLVDQVVEAWVWGLHAAPRIRPASRS